MAALKNSLCPLQPVATGVSHAGWRAECTRANAIYREKADALGRATATGKRLQPVTRDFLRNQYVKISASLKVLGGGCDRRTVMALKDNVNAWETEYPPVLWHPLKKTRAGFRPICVLPQSLKAVHYMLAEAIKQQLVRHSSLYGISGASRDDAARVLKTLQNNGYVYLAKTDIVDCFQSIDPDALYQLPLPREVISRALDLRNLQITMRRHHSALTACSDYSSLSDITIPHEASGPKGLMQGSPASSIILAWLLNGVPTREDAQVMLCFDNLVVAARTPEASRTMVKTLAAHFERCPAGPLALCEPEYADNASMSFLGYAFDPERQDIGICENSLAKLEARLVSVEANDEKELLRIMGEHQRKVAQNGIFVADNPFQHFYPVEIWRTLRDFRYGFPAAEADCAEMAVFKEISADTVAMRGDKRISHLHEHLFADQGTWEHDALRKILDAPTGNPTEGDR